MMVADAIGIFLKQYVGTVFCISGGASLRLIHGCVNAGVKIIPPQNEQSAGFQADCYARIHGMGCAIATSGPGATNLITPIATSFYDSIACLYLVGNQTRARMDAMGTRQYGFQSTPVVEMVRPITKFAKTVMEPEDMIPTLAYAIEVAKSGRPGPVLIDVPDDVQRMML